MIKSNIIKKFFKDKSGSILPSFGLMIMPLIFAVGATFDYADSRRKRTKLSNVADAAILAAAVEVNQTEYLADKDLVKAKMTSTINSFMAANMAGEKNVTYQVSDIRYDPATLAVELDVSFSNATHIMQLAGVDELKGEIETALYLSEPNEQSFSMHLVLDRSGSMNWNGRMTALKAAVHQMTTDFEIKDPDNKYIRMGATSYSSRVRGTTSLQWGADHVDTFTSRLRPRGGTSSRQAMANAAYYLRGDVEKTQHAYKHSSTPKKYILFMTDGANNRSSDDARTLNTCRSAKNDDIIIYTVAFQAPKRGQNLLKSCASSTDHYFEADDAAELISTFKLIGENAGKNLTLTK